MKHVYKYNDLKIFKTGEVRPRKVCNNLFPLPPLAIGEKEAGNDQEAGRLSPDAEHQEDEALEEQRAQIHDLEGSLEG